MSMHDFCRIHYWVALLLLVSGCSTTHPVVVNTENLPQRIPPARAMAACPPLEKLADPSFGSVVQALKKTADAFHECEARRKELSDYIKSGE